MPSSAADEVIRSEAPDRLSAATESRPSPGNKPDAGLEEVFFLLNQHEELDPSMDSSKFAACVERRMNLRRCRQVEQYLELLKTPTYNEAAALMHDLLSEGGAFFKDEGFCEALRAYLERLLSAASLNGLRFWVPACGTGEEVYTLAILISEAMESRRAVPVQIFATDNDEGRLVQARSGLYPQEALKHLDRDRVAKYFIPLGGHFKVKGSVRNLCCFAKHNFLYDPPFMHIDLISGRNLASVAGAQLRKRLFRIYHRSLKPEGRLATLLDAPDEGFVPAEEGIQGIFKKSGGTAPATGNGCDASAAPARARGEMRRDGEDAADILRRDFTPPAAVVDAGGRICQVLGDSSRFEGFDGDGLGNLFRIADTRLGERIRQAVRECALTGADTRLTHSPGGLARETIHARRCASRDGRPLFLVVLERAGTASGETALENELLCVREKLERAMRDLELSNEELRASNEELLSMNEELQSVNGELESINLQLNSKIEALDSLYADMESFFASARIPMLLLNSDLTVRRYTPSIKRVFNLIPSDVGRPITDFTAPFEGGGWLEDIRSIAGGADETLRLVAAPSQERWFEMRARRYEGPQGQTGGIVIAFTDVTEQKRSQEGLARFAALVETSADAIIFSDLDGRVVDWNTGAEELYGYTAEEIRGKSVDVLIPASARPRRAELAEPLLAGRSIKNIETVRLHKDGHAIEVSLSLSPVKSDSGELIGVSCVARDITERKRHLQELERWNELLERRVAERTAEVEKRSTQLRALALQLIRAEKQERRRLSQLLHDHLQQLLVAAKFRLSALRGGTRQDVKRIEELISQSIELSRSLTVELSPPILYDAGVNEIIEWLGRWMRDKYELRVEVETRAASLDVDEELRVFIFDVVRELLFNVSKHAGCKEARVVIDHRDERIDISVSDEGRGFDVSLVRQERKERRRFGIFSIEERLSSIGGELFIDSEPGKGARVRVLIPWDGKSCAQERAASNAGSPERLSAHPRPANRAIDRQTVDVLLVDDNEWLRDGLCCLLQGQDGIRVVGEAASALEAFGEIERLRPNVVIMDINMPGINGLEATKKIKKDHPEIQIIGLSVQEARDLEGPMRQAGAAAYFSKGESLDPLLHVIRNFAFIEDEGANEERR